MNHNLVFLIPCNFSRHILKTETDSTNNEYFKSCFFSIVLCSEVVVVFSSSTS